MKTVFKISYYLRSNYKNREGKCPVMIRISLNGKMCNVGSSGLSVNPEKWDNKHYRMKTKSAEALNFNYQLDEITTSLNNIFKKLSLDNTLNVKLIKELYKGKEKTTTTFFSFFDKYNEEVKSMVGVTITKSTYWRYNRSYKYFKKFIISNYHKNDINLGDLNHLMLDKFINYVKKEDGYAHNYIMKLLQPIKKVSAQAFKAGVINRNPIATYPITSEKTDRGYLLNIELKKIMHTEFSISRLERVRDIFIFSCFTGLAYIDVVNLTTDNLVENEGQYWIMTHRQKTKVASNVLLLDIPLQIIQKYKGKTENNKLLPILSNQKMNSYLKEIADLCGIKKKLTFHLARHTFATTVTLAKGVPIETVSKMLGHTNIKTTQIYARITTDKIQKEMLELSDKLNEYRTV